MRTMLQEQQARAVVAALAGKWHGTQGICRCPAHDDGSPSLSVRAGDSSILVHCFAGCDGKDIMRQLRALGLLTSGEPAQVLATAPNQKRNHKQYARKLWHQGTSINGTLAEAYLRARQVVTRSPALRFLRSTQVGPRRDAISKPAMLAAVTDEMGGIVAVQRTYLALPGQKAAIDSPRRALGPVTEGLVRLAAVGDDGHLGIAEGVETALSSTQIHGIPCWATLGTEMFGMRALPDTVRTLTLYLDNGQGGDRAEQLAMQWRLPGRSIVIARPPRTYGDWNDVLIDRPAAALRREEEETGEASLTN